jgi:hypothetical protein
MWLSREERQLLMFYTACDPDFAGNAMRFSIQELREIVTRRFDARQIAERAVRRGQSAQGTNSAPGDSADAVSCRKSWLGAKATIESACNRLRARGLVEYRECGTGQYEITTKLTGWDLGDRYMRWWSRGVLWFREYKDHWIWLVIGFVGGVLGALLVEWLSR